MDLKHANQNRAPIWSLGDKMLGSKALSKRCVVDYVLRASVSREKRGCGFKTFGAHVCVSFLSAFFACCGPCKVYEN